MKYLFVILCEMISYSYCEKEYFKKKVSSIDIVGYFIYLTLFRKTP